MVDAELLTELRQWAELLDIQKWEVFVVFVLFCVVRLAPRWWDHRVQITKVELSYKRRVKLLDVKLERANARRAKRLIKGK